MSPMRRGVTPLQSILIFLVGVATLAAGYVAQMPIEISAIRDQAVVAPLTATRAPVGISSSQDTAAIDQDNSARSEESLADDMIRRPIFEPTRRPLVANVVPSTQTPPPSSIEPVAVANLPPPRPSGLRYVGILKLGNASVRALLRRETGDSGDNGVWLSIGGSIDDWRVSSIEADHVVVENGGSTERIRLNRGTQTAAR